MKSLGPSTNSSLVFVKQDHEDQQNLWDAALTELDPTSLLSNNLGTHTGLPNLLADALGQRSEKSAETLGPIGRAGPGQSGCFSSRSWALLSPSSPGSPGDQRLFPPSRSPQLPLPIFLTPSWRSRLLPGFLVWPLPSLSPPVSSVCLSPVCSPPLSASQPFSPVSTPRRAILDATPPQLPLSSCAILPKTPMGH